jgi:hypothetical protein
MVLFNRNQPRVAQLTVGLAVIMAGLIVGAIVVFSERVRGILKLSRIAASLPAGDHLLRIGRATVAMRAHKTYVLLALLNTVTLQFIVMVSAYQMALALGMKAGLVHYLIYVPIGFLIAAVPISPPQAFGVLELAYVAFFANTGFGTKSQAVTFALAVRLIQLVWALPGVLVPMFGAHLPSRKELEEVEQFDVGVPDNPVDTG